MNFIPLPKSQDIKSDCKGNGLRGFDERHHKLGFGTLLGSPCVLQK